MQIGACVLEEQLLALNNRWLDARIISEEEESPTYGQEKLTIEGWDWHFVWEQNREEFCLARTEKSAPDVLTGCKHKKHLFCLYPVIAGCQSK